VKGDIYGYGEEIKRRRERGYTQRGNKHGEGTTRREDHMEKGGE